MDKQKPIETAKTNTQGDATQGNLLLAKPSHQQCWDDLTYRDSESIGFLSSLLYFR